MSTSDSDRSRSLELALRESTARAASQQVQLLLREGIDLREFKVLSAA